MPGDGEGALSRLWSWFVPAADSKTLGRRAWGALLLICLVMLGSGITSVPVMDRDEARYAQASKQMLETGDFIDIRFQEAPRHVKPAGIYWMQAASAAIFGGTDAPIAAYRLPSLLGALIAVAGTAWLGARIGGASVGLMAGLFLAASFVMQIEARTAKTDAMLLAAAVIAQAMLFLLVRAGNRPKLKFFGKPALFWAAHGVALMIKGPIIAMVSAATIAALVFVKKERAWLHHLHLVKGLLVTALIALPWVIAITVMTGGAFLEDSIGHALLGKVNKADDSHGGPPGYHLALFMGVYWPGAILAGLYGGYAWLNRKTDHVAFLAAWILPGWIIFELIGTKLPHYVLPVYPAIAILAGLAVRDASALLTHQWVRRVHWASIVVFVVIGLIAAGLAAYGAQQLMGAMPLATLAAAAAGIATVALGVWFALQPTAPRVLAFILSAMTFHALLFGFAAPRVTPLWPSQQMAQLVSGLKGCSTIDVVTAGYREPSNVFYNGTKTYLAATGANAATHLAESPDCSVAFIDQSEWESFNAEVIATGMEPRSIGEIAGINTVKNRALLLTVFVAAQSKLTVVD